MRKRAVRAGLSSASVRAAIRQLEAYRASVPKKLDELCARLAEEGVDAAVAAVPVDTGNLRDGIYLQREGQGEYLVVSYGAYAWFVEFGTGVVGEGRYPGDVPAGWSYDERRTPEAHDPDDPTRWFYYDDKDGKLRSTRGQEGSAYMLASAERMRQRVLAIAKEVFAQ